MPTDHDLAEQEADRSRQVRRVRIAIAVVALAFLAYWGFVFFGDSPENPDLLADRRWTAAAETTCTATVEQIEALPAAEDATGAADRAEVIDKANDLLRTMVDDLGRDEPEGGDGSDISDAEVVEQWLGDWRTFIDDRHAYADELRQDGEAIYLLSAREQRGIDAIISDFAELNGMPSCVDPGDIG